MKVVSPMHPAAREETMEISTYCVLRKFPSGIYEYVEELDSLEKAQIRSLLLEADHPGEYVVCNSASGKVVTACAGGPYVC